jgi:zinc protease
MHSWLRVLAAFVCAFSLAGPAAAAKARETDQPVASVEGISEYRLQNGLRYLLFPDPSRATVTVNITYLVGSHHENYGETGMAHLLEHLMYKGTPKYGNLFQALSSRGMDYNGTTSFDRTNYYETFPASDEDLRWAIRMEADRMVHSFIARRDLDSEMTVVRNEMEEGENSPSRILSERVQATAFEWHNYGRSAIGARSDVENVDIGRLKAFYRKYYQPDNAVLVIAGNFDAARVRGWIRESFGGIPRPTRVLPPSYTLEPPQDGERQVTLRRTGNTQFMEALYHSLAGGDPDYPAFELLVLILGDTPSGRLYKALVETGKASAVYGSSEALIEPGFVSFGAQVRQNDSLASAQEALLATIEGLRSQPVTEAEVRRAKVKLLKDIELALNDPQQMGISLSEDIAAGDWRLFFLFRDRVRDMTAAEVQRVAEAYLKRANRTLGLFIPDPNPDRAPASGRVDVAKAVQDYRGESAVEPGEAFVATPGNIESRTVRGALANGMKLAVMPKKTRGHTLSVSLRLNFGDEQSLLGRSPAGLFAASMLMRGTKRHARQELEDEFDRLKTTVSVSGDETGLVVAMDTVREHFPEAFALLAEILKEPAFPAAEFDEIRRSRLAALESGRSDPQTLASTMLYRHGNPFPPGHVRYVETLDEQIAATREANLENVKRFYLDFYGASYAQLGVVGDVDPSDVQRLGEREFGLWKNPKPYERVPNPYRDIAPQRFTIDIEDRANAVYMARVPIPMREDSRDYPALLLANYILGGSTDSRLFNRIRQKEGLSYSVGSSFTPDAYEPNSNFSVYAIYAPQSRKRLDRAFAEELSRIVQEGVTPEEVENAKAAIALERRLALTQDAPLAATLARDLRLGRTMAFIQQVDQALAALTAADVNAALKKYLHPDAMSAVFAGEFSKSVQQAGSGSAR